MGLVTTSPLRQAWSVLTSQQRRSAVALLGFMMFGMILETLGIGLVIPALAVMSQNDLAVDYPAARPVLQALGNPTQERLVAAGMLVLVIVYALKAAFLAYLAWRQMRFVYGVQADLSHRLYETYLRQPYAFHLARNSAQLIRNAVTEVNVFTQIGLMSGLTLLTELLVVLGISLLLLAVEPVGAMVVVAVLGVAGWGFQRFTHHRIARWAEARQVHDGLRIQHLQQGLAGAKDVILTGREDAFLAEYRQHSDGTARAGQLQQTLQQMPRLVLEFLTVCGLAALVFVMIGRKQPVGALLPTLGLFAAAAFRLMPSANRVIGAFQNVRYAMPSITVMHKEIELESVLRRPASGEPLRFARELALKAVSFTYVDAQVPALIDVSIQVQSGTSVGFIGGSGAGKSTLVDVILGLLQPQSGAVLVDDRDVHGDLRGWQNLIGYVPQSIFLTDDTLRRNVAFGLMDSQIDETAIWRAIDAAQLGSYVRTLPEGLDTMVGERGVRLSGGQLQRVGIARALYNDPQILVLDEATSSLDTETERGVMEAVHALHGRKTVLIVAHRLSTVQHCDYLYKMDYGRIVSRGVPGEVLMELTHV